jgi:hypothetical protein
MIWINIGLFLPMMISGSFEIFVHLNKPFAKWKENEYFEEFSTLTGFILNFVTPVWFQFCTLS